MEQVSSAQTVTGMVFRLRFRLFLGECRESNKKSPALIFYYFLEALLDGLEHLKFVLNEKDGKKNEQNRKMMIIKNINIKNIFVF